MLRILLLVLLALPASAQVQRVEAGNGLKNTGSPLSVLLEADLSTYDGDINLSSGSTITTEPGPEAGNIVFDEVAGGGGHTFTFGVRANLAGDFKCEVTSDGSWQGDCGGGGGGESVMNAKGFIASVQTLNHVTLDQISGVGKYDLVSVTQNNYQLMSVVQPTDGVTFNGSAQGVQWTLAAGHKYSIGIKVGPDPYCSWTIYDQDDAIIAYPGQFSPDGSVGEDPKWPQTWARSPYFEIDATSGSKGFYVWRDGNQGGVTCDWEEYIAGINGGNGQWMRVYVSQD